jgi:VWFA-related protein
MRNFLKLLFPATLCALTLAGQSQTQQTLQAAQNAPAQAPVQSSTVLKITSRLVVVDVVALDHKGQPVTDLTAEDFTVLEEGKEQKVSAFSFQRPVASARGSAAVTAPVKLPPRMFTNIPRQSTSGALNVVLLDALNTQATNQAYVREQMIKFLTKIPEGQPVAVYALGTRLRLLQDFTTDPAVLKAAIAHLKDKSSPLLNNPTGSSELSLLGPGVFDAMPASMQQAVLQFQAEQVSMQTDLRVRLTLDALTSIARTLSGYPGRKNLIWVSETFPINIIPDFSLGTNGSTTQRDYSANIAATANILTDAQVAVYPVDAKALFNSGYYSVGNNNTNSTGQYMGNVARGGGLGTELGKESDTNLAGRSTMNDLAKRTGGKAFYNTNDVDNSILKSIEDGSTYYTLGYNPENKDWNGKFRKITVKTKRSGTKLRYRLGYFAADPKSYAKVDARQRAIDLGQALSLDFPVSTALPFRVLVNPPSAKTENKVLIDYAIDSHAISFELQADGLQHASWECAAEVYSTKGAVAKQDGRGMTASLNPDEFNKIAQSFVPCRQIFDLAPGDYFLRVGVRDASTGLIGTANATLTVPPLPPAGVKPEEKKPQ